MTPRDAIVASGSLAGIPGTRRLRSDLDRLGRLVRRAAGRPVRVDVAFTSDRAIRTLNRRHLGHDFATDVVSWPLSGPDDPVLVGALAVSRDTARREAERRRRPPYHELMLYVVHGLLHLCGHGDKAPGETSRMRRAEREWLSALGLPSVFDDGQATGGPATGGPATGERARARKTASRGGGDGP